MYAAVVGRTRVPVGASVCIRVAEGIGILHIPDGTASVDTDIATHQPVIGTLGVVFDGFAEDIGEGFVEGARLVLIGQVGRKLRHAVGDLMPHDVEGDEGAVGGAITIAVGHPAAVPECVDVVGGIVDVRLQGCSLVVIGGPVVGRLEISECLLRPPVGLVGGGVGCKYRRGTGDIGGGRIAGTVSEAVGLHAAGGGGRPQFVDTRCKISRERLGAVVQGRAR